MKKILASIIALTLIVFIGYSYVMIKATDIPRDKKILEISTTKVEASITIPDGNHFELLINTPENRSFHGHCIVKENTKVLKEFSFDSNSSIQANWLSDKTSGTSYLLGWYTNMKHSHFQNVFKENETYSIVLTFDSQLPKGSSLWLGWLD